ncbi:C40 family peptidase [Streptomyces sp. NPDC050504]|uniref:C40 family peptidase n=1 Tax=Streptomyces sp. NPDC050504 TaxID=3365618 RepID=UPI0037B3E67E
MSGTGARGADAGSRGRARGRGLRVAGAAAVVLAALTAAPVPAAAEPAPVTAAAEPSSVAGLLTRLQTLYRQTEEASEAYNAVEEALKRERAATARATGALTRSRLRLARSRGEMGRLAREEYQGRVGISPYLHLLLSRDARRALDQSHVLERAARARTAAVARLERRERGEAELAKAARRALDKQQELARTGKERRDAVRGRLEEVEALLASLTPEQLAEVARLESAQLASAQRELLASGALSGERAPSDEGDAALRYAVAQIGKPYVWGAEGPGAFDCSGLTSQAWGRAGRAIPRTSQEQWKRLPKVPLRALRPGDLVVYFPKATHVAMYLGDGMVVQAPRPGARVKVSPIAANPLLGAVRPDPGAGAVESYAPPELPPGAGAGADTGFNG